MPQTPTCLHIPMLYEEALAETSWEPIANMSSYQVECVFDETFERAGTGRSWTAMDATDKTWSQMETEELSWEQFEKLSAQGLTWQNIEYSGLSWDMLHIKNHTWNEIETLPASFLIFDGVGVSVRTPDQGLSWSLLASKSQDWGEIKANGLSWQEFELLPCTGLMWSQLDGEKLAWNQIEEQGKTWRECAEEPARGRRWEILDALYSMWDERDAKGITWDAFERLPPENRTHLTFSTVIPLYKKYAFYRIKAFNGIEYSDYLTSTLQKINPRSLAKYCPPCLHIPELHETQNAQIVWGELYGASDYVLERAFTGDFTIRYDGPGKPAATPTDCDVWKKLWYTPDCKRHFSFTDVLPAGERQVKYRIKGRNTTDESQYLASVVIPVIPVFYREDSVVIPVVAGARYNVQLHAKSIEMFREIVMRLSYNAELLSVEQFSAEQPTNNTDMGHELYSGNIRELSREKGSIRFQCIRPMVNNKKWDGLIVCVRFRAMKTGSAEIILR